MENRRVAFLSLLLFAALSTSRAAELQRFEFSQPHMGTTFRIVLYSRDAEVGRAAAMAAFDRIEELNGIMSDYKADSELMNLVHAAGGAPMKIGDDLFNVLKISKDAAKASDGAFDISLGPVIRLWRRARRQRVLPEPEKLAEAMKLVGCDKLELDENAHTARLTVPGMVLDLGGIGKGYAADAAIGVLKRHNIDRGLVAAGGDITVSNRPPDAEGWAVGIAPLASPENAPKIVLMLENQSVSTSGDAEQFVEIGGVRYSHIVDPKTGLGLIGHKNVTVVGPNGTTADWMTKVVSVQGEKGFKLIDATDGVASLIVRQGEKGEEQFQSARWKELKFKLESK